MCCLFQIGCAGNGTKFAEPNLLKEEFDLCPYWRDQMSWRDFTAKRNRQKNPGLVKYVDKIQQQKIARENGIEVAKTYVATNEKMPIVSILDKLDSYVAKATHMSFSGGLIIVKNGIDIITGKPITSKEVEEKMFAVLNERSRDVESWALHQVKPGFMIQEYIPDRKEIKIQTVWGRAVVGELRGGESQSATTPVRGKYDRDGLPITGNAPAPSIWLQAVALAERISQKTDALRVDFLIDESSTPPRILLNEMEIWPESNWSGKYGELAAMLNAGYAGKCRVSP